MNILKRSQIWNGDWAFYSKQIISLEEFITVLTVIIVSGVTTVAYDYFAVHGIKGKFVGRFSVKYFF